MTFSIDTLTDEIQPTVTEKMTSTMERRSIRINSNFWKFWTIRSLLQVKVNDFSKGHASTSEKCLIGNLIDEMKLMLMEK